MDQVDVGVRAAPEPGRVSAADGAAPLLDRSGDARSNPGAMSGIILQVARRIPAHRRPLVLAVIVPLAATCLLTASLMPAAQATASHRQEAVASLQERQRRLCECLMGEDLLDDPPASVDSARAAGASKAVAAAAGRQPAVPFALERRAGLPDTHASFLHFQPLPRTDPRGPPRAATCG